jgi:hypothetical protein
MEDPEVVIDLREVCSLDSPNSMSFGTNVQENLGGNGHHNQKEKH